MSVRYYNAEGRLVGGDPEFDDAGRDFLDSIGGKAVDENGTLIYDSQEPQ